MTVQLNDVWAACGGLAAVVAVLTGIFAVLRYIIRAETKELRPNGGGSIKDAIGRIDKRLDDHLAKDAQEKEDLRQVVANLAAALPTVAASTPPEV